MKVSPLTVNRALHTSDIQTGILERICEVLQVPVTFFYEGSSSQEPGETEGRAGSNRNATDTVSDAATAPTDSNNENFEDTAKIWATNRIGDKVKTLLKLQQRKMRDLCQYVGMTGPGLRLAFERDTCNISVLMKTAEFFDVPVTHFLPEDPHTKEENEKDREIEYLKGQVKAYEITLVRVLSELRGTESASPLILHTTNE